MHYSIGRGEGIYRLVYGNNKVQVFSAVSLFKAFQFFLHQITDANGIGIGLLYYFDTYAWFPINPVYGFIFFLGVCYACNVFKEDPSAISGLGYH